MIQQIRKIGNSSGIIIPKSMLVNCDSTQAVELKVVNYMIIIKPLKKKARENREQMFNPANQNCTLDDDLFEGIQSEFDKNGR